MEVAGEQKMKASIMSFKNNIKLFYVYKFVSSFLFLGPIIIIFFLDKVSYTELGVIMGASMIASILFEIPSGVLADILGRKKIVILGELLAITELALLVLFQNFWGFLISGLIGGIGIACISGADTSLLYDSLKKTKQTKQSKKIYGRMRAMRYLGIVCASLVGAPLYLISKTLPITLTILTVIAGLIIFLLIKDIPPKEKHDSIKKKLSFLKKAWKQFTQSYKLRWYVYFSIFSSVFIWTFHDLFRTPYYLSIGIPIAALGIITAIITLIRSYFSLKAAEIEKKLGEHNTQRLMLFLPGALLVTLGLVESYISIIVAIVIYIVWSLQEVLTEVYVHENVASKYRATVFSINSFGVSITLLVGALTFGFLADTIGLDDTLILLGIVAIVSGIWIEVKKKNAN
jgi:MFS family permease